MTSQGGPHLGLVEDSPEDFAAFERIVNRQAPGLNLRRWRHAEALLEDLNAPDPQGSWPTALVVDLNLPGMDGAELVRRLRAQPATQSLPMFVLSGSERQQDVDRCYAAGANAYLTKPGGAAELRALVQMLLASIAAFRTPTSVGGTDGLTSADLTQQVDQRAIDAERDRYEERLLAERTARRRAEVLQRLASRLADVTSVEQVEAMLLKKLADALSSQTLRIERPAPGTSQREALFMPDPFGAGMVALLPLTYDDGAVASVLRVESPGALGDDDEALLHSATALASQALGRVRRRASPMWADADYASDLPTARWWRDAIADVFRDAAAHRVPVSLVVIEVDLRTVDAQVGAPAADARLLAVVDAWRRLSVDLLAPLGTEVLVALLPGRAAREAQALVAKAHAEFVDPALLRCAVAEWDGTESGDELLTRARAAVRRDPSSASG